MPVTTAAWPKPRVFGQHDPHHPLVVIFRLDAAEDQIEGNIRKGPSQYLSRSLAVQDLLPGVDAPGLIRPHGQAPPEDLLILFRTDGNGRDRSTPLLFQANGLFDGILVPVIDDISQGFSVHPFFPGLDFQVHFLGERDPFHANNNIQRFASCLDIH